ncbi:hypothetical protein [Corynebacterium sp. LaCa116]|uniref:hypothetical protein n=1 Tax=Corynebacterium sp. LaCa116 TaxID=3391423 RepID=UPI003989312E
MSNYDRALKALEAARRPGDLRIHPNDAVEALGQAGLIAPDLPEPSCIVEEHGEKRICWGAPGCDIELTPGEMITTYEAQAGHEIEHAHAYALALLAAVNYQEEA